MRCCNQNGDTWLVLRREDVGDRSLVETMLRQKGLDPDDAILVIPPRQLISVYFNPRGEVDAGQLNSDQATHNETRLLLDRVRSSAAQRILFLPHAVRQMSRPDRMITTREVRGVVENGVVIEAYEDDPRGVSCLMLGYGTEERAIHLVCSPKDEFLAIITAYLPNHSDWSDDFQGRIKR